MSLKRVGVTSDHMKVYGPEFDANNPLERGQVFTMSNQLNDEKLLGWHYVRELEPKEETYTCKCGREFLGGATDTYARAHAMKWRGDCSPVIDVDGPRLKGKKPQLRGGGDPDAEGPGWDVGVGATEGPPSDPYEGPRDASGKERMKRVSLGG